MKKNYTRNNSLTATQTKLTVPFVDGFSYVKKQTIYMKKGLLILMIVLGAFINVNGQLFTQNFDAATSVAYSVSGLSLTTSSGNNLVGTGANLFTSITGIAKSSCGIAINNTTGYPGATPTTGSLMIYSNNTSYYWSAVRTGTFATTAPTAIKFQTDIYFNEISSGSNQGINLGIGNGLADGYNTASAPASTLIHSGFSISANSSPAICAFNTATTISGSSSLTHSTWKTITWIINNSGSTLSYTDPTGGTSTVTDDHWDLWMGSTRIVAAAAATTGTVALQQLYLGSNSGKKHEVRFDNMSITDLSPVVNTSPTFLTASPSLSICQDASATSISSLLHVSDADASQTETWSQSVAPSHGSLSFSSATASSGSTDITPGGTITYTPTSGYSGSDAFTIQVSDGTATVTKVVNVTVNARPSAAALTGTTSVCGTTSTNLSVAVTGGASPFSVVLSPSGSASSTTPVTVSVSPSSSTQYSITSVTDNNGCTVASPTGTPTITVNSVSIAPTSLSASVSSICNGSTTTLTQNGGTLGTGATWKWYSDNTYSTLVGTGSGATGSLSVTPSSSTTYYARSENGTSPCSATVSDNTKSVTVSVTAAISGVTQPSDWSSCSGNATSVTVGSPSNVAGYHWQVNTGSGFNDISNGGVYSNATTATLNISDPAGFNGYSYQCVLNGTSPCSNVTSSAATLSVTSAPDVSNFTATSTPSTTCLGSNTVVTVNSTSIGAGTYTVTYNVSGASGNSATLSTATLTMGSSSGTFTITGAALSHSGATTITITGIASGCNSVVSSNNTANFTVNTLPTPSISPTTAVCAGSSSNIYTTQSSMTGYTWTITGTGSSVTSGGTSTDNSVTVTWGTGSTGHVKVNYTDANGCSAASQTDQSITLTAQPAITSSPSGTSAAIGANPTFSVGASGAGLIYQWEVNTGSGWTSTLNGSSGSDYYTGSTTAILTINNVSLSSKGYLFRCGVSGTCSPTVYSGSATLKVQLATPTIGSGSLRTTTGFTANWTTVSSASSYQVDIYQGVSHITTISGISGSSTAVTGLTSGTAYTYTVTAIGDGTTTTSSTASSASASITTFSTACSITAFTFSNATPTSSNITGSSSPFTVSIVMPAGTNRYTLIPSITISANATINPTNGTNLDFRSTQAYTVTAEDGVTTKSYNVTVTEPASTTTATWLASSAGTYAAPGYTESAGLYAKATGGGAVTFNTLVSTCQGSTQSTTMGSSLFIFKPTSSVNKIILYGNAGSGGSRTLSSVTTSSTITGTYTALSPTSTGVITSISSVEGCANDPMVIVLGQTIAAGTYIKITLSGNAHLSAIDLINTSVTDLTVPTVGAASSVTSTGFTANWTPAGNDANAISYNVNVYNSSDLSFVKSYSGSGNSAVFTGLNPNTKYIYNITAVGDGDVYSSITSPFSSVSTIPSAFTVGGGGNYCLGSTSSTITLNGSETGVSYQVKFGATSYGSPLSGNGSALNFTGITFASGTNAYTIVATNSTLSTTATMNGSANVTLNSLPATLAANDITVTYDGATHSISATPGTGETIDWYSAATAGSLLSSASTSYTPSVVNVGIYNTNYYAVARNTTTSCVSASRQVVTLTITTKPLTMSGLSVPASKVYDGTTTAVVSGATGNLQSTETAGAGTTADGKPYDVDAVSITGTATGTYNSKDVASATTVTYGGLSLTGTGFGNYSLTMQGTAAATITAKALTMSGLSVPASKVYDGTTTAVVSGSGSLQSAETAGTGTTADGKPYAVDVVSITGTAIGTYDSKDVASATTVTYSGLSLTGSNAGNYTLTIQGTAAATIATKALTMSGLSVPASKIYNGTTTAVVSGGSGSLQSTETAGAGTTADGKPYDVDAVSITGTATGTYNSKDVASATTVAYGGLSLAGTGFGNYSLTMQGTSSATITAKALTMSGLSVPASKVYDGTTTAIVTGSPGSLQSTETAGTGTTADGKPYAVDVVSITGTATGTYDSKDVASATTVTYGGLSLTGSNAGNYILTMQGTAAATITTAPLTITGISIANKTFDGLTTATISGSAAYSGLQNSESYTVTGTPTASFATASIANTKSVTVSGYTAPSTNYSISQPTGLTANITAGAAGVWLGNVSNVYTNPANWADNNVPGSSVSISIPTGSNYPAITGSQSVNNLAISSGSTVTVTGTLNVAGNITNSGTLNVSAGTLVLNSSTSAQTITGGCTVQNITVDNTHGVTLGSTTPTAADTVFVTGVYTPTAGTLTTNGNLVLVSNASGTASVAAGSGTYMSGNLVVQRYHISRRAWLMLSAPLTTAGTTGISGSIHDNWQQQTYITAPSTYQANGLDPAPNNAYSMLNWTGAAWGHITNTSASNTLIGNAGGNTADNKPFFMYIRGDRTVPAVPGGTSKTDVTLKANGALQMGDKTFDISTTASSGGYALVANPYPAPISLDQFFADNPSLNTGANNYIYYWDPNNASSGGYTTVGYDNTGARLIASGDNTGNAQPWYIQNGQAFFVTKGSSNTITFKETQKSTGNMSNTVFGNSSTGSIKINLLKGTNYMDGIVTMYNNKYNAAVIAPTEDASKFWGNEEAVALVRTGSYLSVEARPEIAGADTSFLYMNKLAAGNTYTFNIAGSNMPSNVTGVLVDKYTNASTALNLTSATSISFTVDTAAAAKAANRFMIVLNAKAPLYVSDIKVKASVKARAAVIDWSVATEKEVKSYTIEHSTTASDFKAINTTAAKNSNNSNYSYTDNSAPTGDNYYRIKAINTDGSVQYSSIAKVTIGDRKEGMSIYPNPVVGKTMNVQLSNIAAGTYSLSMINANGQQVMEQQLQHAGGSVTSTVQLPSTVASGIYQLRLASNGKSYVETVIVK